LKQAEVFVQHISSRPPWDELLGDIPSKGRVGEVATETTNALAMGGKSSLTA
jgi:hypothetical protein